MCKVYESCHGVFLNVGLLILLDTIAHSNCWALLYANRHKTMDTVASIYGVTVPIKEKDGYHSYYTLFHERISNMYDHLDFDPMVQLCLCHPPIIIFISFSKSMRLIHLPLYREELDIEMKLLLLVPFSVVLT